MTPTFFCGESVREAPPGLENGEVSGSESKKRSLTGEAACPCFLVPTRTLCANVEVSFGVKSSAVGESRLGTTTGATERFRRVARLELELFNSQHRIPLEQCRDNYLASSSLGMPELLPKPSFPASGDMTVGMVEGVP